jgi:hypothetical protein
MNQQKTPQKGRQRRQNNASQSHPVPLGLVSDYDSEAYYTAPAQQRTVEEINFSVIRRYVPSLQRIIAKAPSAVVYTLIPTTGQWDKANIEGTLFVCQLTPSPTTGTERHCIVILNRKGLENLIIESGEIANVEITDEFLLLEFRSKNEELDSEVRNIMGFYLHSYQDTPREEICQLIKEHWEIAMRDRIETQAEEGVAEEDVDDSFRGSEIGRGESKPMGRRLSLTELFGQR